MNFTRCDMKNLGLLDYYHRSNRNLTRIQPYCPNFHLSKNLNNVTLLIVGIWLYRQIMNG